MPGFVTHELFGIDVFHLMEPGKVKDCVQSYFAAFRLGLQGPDLLFYDVFSMIHEDHRSIGAYMHEHRVSRFFTDYLNRLKTLEGEEQKIATAYLTGFLCHHASDRFCHPYIYARAGHKLDSGERGSFPLHARLENEIDAELMRRLRGKKVTELRQADAFCLPKKQREVVANQFGNVLRDVFGDLYHVKGRRLSPWYIKLCMRLGAVEARFQMDRKGRKAAGVERLERVFHIPHIASSKFIAPRKPIEEDCLNLQHLPWRNPWKTEKISHASLLELYQQAENCMYRELNALEAFLKGKDDGVCLIALIGDASYHSGLPENVSLNVTSVSEQKEAR